MERAGKFLSIFFFMGFLGGAVQGGDEPFLLKDINTRTHSNPGDFTPFGDHIIFTATDGEVALGRELWITDGTQGGTRLIKDIKPGAEGSDPEGFAVMDGLLYFSADDGEHGRELWVTDGSEDGTRLVKDISPGASSCGFESLTASGGLLYFSANDGEHGYEVWVSDGSEDGTRLIKDITPGPSRGISGDLTASGGLVYFRGTDHYDIHDSLHDWELWVTDGSEEGTRLLKDIRPGEKSSNLCCFTALGSRVCFTANDGIHGAELWVTDGTEEGTKLFKNILPDFAGSAPKEFTVSGDLIYFFVNNGESGGALWATDGTEAGTYFIADFKPRAESLARECYGLTASGGRLYFFVYQIDARDSIEYDYEFWVSDGTEAGTKRIKTVWTGSREFRPDDLIAWDIRIYFTVFDKTHGRELWTSDGTEAGTKLFKDIWPGRKGSDPGLFTVSGDRLFFSADDGEQGRELWVSDGTEGGTRLLADINREVTACFNPFFVPAGPFMLFFGLYNDNGGLWITDGSREGTRFLKDIDPVYDFWNPMFAAYLDGRACFFADDGKHGPELWVTDGTEEGTKILKDIMPGEVGSSPKEVTIFGDRVYFRADDGEHGEELWVSDGTEEGTHLFKDINPGPEGSVPFIFTVSENRLYFYADGALGHEFWVTDGTEEGTRRLKDAWVSPGGVRTILNGLFYSFDWDREHGLMLYVSDGTGSGARLVKDIQSGRPSGQPEYTYVVGDRFCFRFDDGEHGAEIWVSDGTESGTRLLKDIMPGRYGSYPYLFTVSGNRLYFFANDGEHGSELWVTDGTEAGTRLFKDLKPGSDFFYPSYWNILGGLVYLIDSDGIGNYELWVANSVEGGVVNLFSDSDVKLRFFSRSIPIYWPEKSLLLFPGNNGLTGSEPWAFRLSVPTVDFAMTPAGCQSGRTVTLDASTSTTPAGTAITSYTWDMGKGVVLEGSQVEYTYPGDDEGDMEICLTVTNDVGFSQAVCRTFCIVNAFVRGDVNGDGGHDLADAIFAMTYLFADGEFPACLDAADANDDGKLDLADVIAVLNHLFLPDTPLAQPFPECGVDPSRDDLPCGAYPACEG